MYTVFIVSNSPFAGESAEERRVGGGVDTGVVDVDGGGNGGGGGILIGALEAFAIGCGDALLAAGFVPGTNLQFVECATIVSAGKSWQHRMHLIGRFEQRLPWVVNADWGIYENKIHSTVSNNKTLDLKANTYVFVAMGTRFDICFTRCLVPKEIPRDHDHIAVLTTLGFPVTTSKHGINNGK
ncbi:hypothetical protein P3T76_012103 [Phytophthora citrophthora]|uniref:Endonuclease/exonuclease/phosphatase domain-containing protein n=1 Tax=Phytophthora citrophthora TaxID=4793 RepID=A0AAD9G684_9STRA|nr:hypothetical protein P3T76_012103 [Phytophthora citrophthora]